MGTSIVLAIFVTAVATYISRFLGVLSSEKIKETSKIFRWFNCLAYSTLAALIARMIVFPVGALSEVDYLIRFIVILLSILIFYFTRKNVVYPTVFSAIILTFLKGYF
ncbi:MAG: branched-chain amino acid transporter [Candidatus Pelagibacter sp.]|nr:MAG: branched-chain amino acid transporter [Candidatus Pelagibacter sp.]